MQNLWQWHYPETAAFGPVNLVVIQASPFCNLNCDYCYLPDRSAKQRFSVDLLTPLFRELFASRFVDTGFTVVWHAGEPLAVPLAFYESAFTKIGEVDRQFNSEHYRISHAMQTNGTLLNQAWCDFIKAHNIRIGVSLDGPAFIHDAHRRTRAGRGTHAATMKGVALLQRNGIDVHVITVLTQDALAYPDELFHFFLEHGIRRVGFNIEEVEGSNPSSSLQKTGTEERYRAFMERFYELTKGTNGALKVREFEHLRNLILAGKPITVGQFTPFSMLNIDCNGNFSTFSPELLSMKSPLYGDFILGNLMHDTFESVCDTDKFKRINMDIQAGVALCQRTCEHFSLCGGGAPANKYFENHTFRSSETMYCRYTRKILVDILLADIEAFLGLR